MALFDNLSNELIKNTSPNTLPTGEPSQIAQQLGAPPPGRSAIGDSMINSFKEAVAPQIKTQQYDVATQQYDDSANTSSLLNAMMQKGGEGALLPEEKSWLNEYVTASKSGDQAQIDAVANKRKQVLEKDDKLMQRLQMTPDMWSLKRKGGGGEDQDMVKYYNSQYQDVNVKPAVDAVTKTLGLDNTGGVQVKSLFSAFGQNLQNSVASKQKATGMLSSVTGTLDQINSPEKLGAVMDKTHDYEQGILNKSFQMKDPTVQKLTALLGVVNAYDKAKNAGNEKMLLSKSIINGSMRQAGLTAEDYIGGEGDVSNFSDGMNRVLSSSFKNKGGIDKVITDNYIKQAHDFKRRGNWAVPLFTDANNYKEKIREGLTKFMASKEGVAIKQALINNKNGIKFPNETIEQQATLLQSVYYASTGVPLELTRAQVDATKGATSAMDVAWKIMSGIGQGVSGAVQSGGGSVSQ